MSSTGLAAYAKESDRTEMVEKYGYLVNRIAHHLLVRLPSSVQLDDLYQAGMLGLLESIAKYDPARGASFETYAGIRIRGAMLDEVRRGDWAPRSVHRNKRRVLETIKTIEAETGREPSDRDVAAAMELSLADYHAIVQDAADTRLASFEEINQGEDTGLLPRFEPGDHGVERAALFEALNTAIGNLPEREKLVMALYYNEELNLKEIGAVLDVSESRISQILSQATSRVREKIANWRDE